MYPGGCVDVLASSALIFVIFVLSLSPGARRPCSVDEGALTGEHAPSTKHEGDGAPSPYYRRAAPSIGLQRQVAIIGLQPLV